VEGSIRKREKTAGWRDGGRRIRATTGEEWLLIASEGMRRGVKKER